MLLRKLLRLCFGRFVCRFVCCFVGSLFVDFDVNSARRSKGVQTRGVVFDMSRALYDQVVLFGDSITQYAFNPNVFSYGSALADVYQRRLDVIGRGFSGYNTNWAMPILEQILPRNGIEPSDPKLLLLVIFFGANDACLPHSPQHVPIDQFSSNLHKMISFIRSKDSPYYSSHTRIILITPPPIDPERWQSTRTVPLDRPDREVKVTKAYAEAVVQVAKEASIPVVDLWNGIMDRVNEEAPPEQRNLLEKLTTCQRSGLEKYLTDGLHLDGPGYQVLYDILMPLIKSKYPELDPDNIPMTLPWWGDIDVKNLPQSLNIPLLGNL